MSNITFQEEVPTDEFISEFLVVASKHHTESDQISKRFDLEPDWNTYISLYNMGMVKTMTIRDEGKLVGYYNVLIAISPHHKKMLCATCDVFFVLKEYRKGMLAIKFLKYVEKTLKNYGINVLSLNTTSEKPLTKLLERLGWTFTECVFTKYIGE